MLNVNISEIKFDNLSITQIFERVCHLPHAVLLDTCTADLKVGYSIMAHSPALLVNAKNGKIEIENKSKNISINDNVHRCSSVFEVLSDLQQQVVAQINVVQESELPFLCGWLGSFGYDLNIQTDNIDGDGAEEYDLPDVDICFYTNSIIVDHSSKKIFLVSIENEQPEWMKSFACSTPVNNAFRMTTDWESNLSPEDYSAKFQRIKQYLTSGDCYQVNFAQRFSADYTGSEFEAYKMLRESNQAPFSAFLNLGQSTIISVSPERFLSLKNAKVETKPIKGTIPRHSDAKIDSELAQNLQNSTKDRAENLMIVDLLRNDLSKHCRPNSVKVPALFELESYPAVHHLVSTVTGELRSDSNAFDVLSGAFPGGSITGCPKVRAMQIISELEPNKRSIYCGSIGYVGIRDDMDLNICIRTILAEKGKLYCWAGGGIVIDSDVESEYKETQDKVAKILPLLSKHSEQSVLNRSTKTGSSQPCSTKENTVQGSRKKNKLYD